VLSYVLGAVVTAFSSWAVPKVAERAFSDRL
jgi:hypothetical protein